MDIGSLLKQLHDNKDIVDSSLVSSSSPFSIHPMDSLFVAAAKLLIKNTHIHRIPLVDEQLGCCILSIMEASRLVKFIAANVS